MRKIRRKRYEEKKYKLNRLFVTHPFHNAKNKNVKRKSDIMCNFIKSKIVITFMISYDFLVFPL